MEKQITLNGVDLIAVQTLKHPFDGQVSFTECHGETVLVQYSDVYEPPFNLQILSHNKELLKLKRVGAISKFGDTDFDIEPYLDDDIVYELGLNDSRVLLHNLEQFKIKFQNTPDKLRDKETDFWNGVILFQ